MKTSDFDYYLPEELIAQEPNIHRDEARLLIYHKNSNKIEHKLFKDIIDYLDEGDTLVMNDTKVIPARLIGKKEDTGGVIEVLLLKDLNNKTWECLCKPARKVKLDTVVVFSPELKARCTGIGEEGIRHFQFIYQGIFMEILDRLGNTPLPPYIHKELKDKTMYNTVYAKEEGSAAAPTAGLHFTNELLKKLEDKKINLVYLTLHIGLGTFRPVSEEDIKNHTMHSEYYLLSKESADAINKTIKNNHKVVAVGTTVVRTLETIMTKYNTLKEDSGWTNIYIYPGYKYKIVNNLITNFHLPKSTLIMLVAALTSTENILNVYNTAVNNKYKFFSFGDAMFIIDD